MSVPNNLVSDRVFERIVESILTAHEPGSRLPTQRAMAQELGVTMSSVREALKRVEQMGLVDVRHGDGMIVRDARNDGGLDVLTHLLFRPDGISPGVLSHVLEARSLLLRELAGLAATRRRDEQADALAGLAAEFARQCPDPKATALVDLAFFTEVARAADNLVFDLILNATRDIYLRDLDAVPVTRDPEPLAPCYARIAEQIRDRDAEGARATTFALATLHQERAQP